MTTCVEEHSRSVGSDAKQPADAEKSSLGDSVVDVEYLSDDVQDSASVGVFTKLTAVVAKWGVETNGIVPVPPEQRTDSRIYQQFFVWFAGNANVYCMAAGTVGPAYYDLGIRDASLVILVVDLVTSVFPAYFAVFGPKLGTRAMVQSKYSWGYYGGIIPSVLNVVTCQGYVIINTIVGGQTLGAVSPHLGSTLGIVIISIITLVVVFCGYRFLHWYEMVVWIPNVIAFIVMLGVSGKHVVDAPVTNPTPISAANIMTFGATLAATVISYATITPDYGVYHDKNASTWRIFIYAYLGLIVASMPAHLLGAAFAATAVYVPSWEAGLGNGNDIGGLMAAILSPAGGFGKFLLVLLSLTAPSIVTLSMYTTITSFMTVTPVFSKIPRYLLAIVSTAVSIPVSIVGASKFYETFVDILSLIGYWCAPFIAIVLVEHFVFRHNSWSEYDITAWDQPNHPNLPKGYAAVFTFVATVGFIVVCMDQEWWVGPIAQAGTGDVGILLGFVIAVMIHLPARWLEKRLESRQQTK